MKSHSLILSITALYIGVTSCTSKPASMALTYPETEQRIVTDTFFETVVEDPYRWLEDDRSEETSDWVKRQNEVTYGFLNQIPYREELKEKLTKIWNYEKVGTPFKEGRYTYFYKNDGLQNQSVLYRQLTNDTEAEVFLDPNTFSEDGTVSLAGLSFTKDGLLAAYSISEGGSDWRKIIVIDTETRKQIEDTIVDVKFSGVSWKNADGFYYSSYDKPDGSELSAKTDQHKLYYHKLDTAQQNDELIFGGAPGEKHRYIGGSVTEDGNFLFITASNTTSGNKLFVQDLRKPNAPIQTILDHEDSDTYPIDNRGETFYLTTDLDAPNRKVVSTTLSDLKNWETIIPEKEHVLSINTGGGYLFAEYMVDALSKAYQYTYSGELVREVALPGLGSVGGLGGKNEDAVLYYSFTNYNTPSSSYTYDVTSGASELYWSPAIDFDPSEYISEQVFYSSKDGTRIPMMITYKKGIKKDGNNPTILYGYGGFNVSLTPSFSTANAVWMDLGGIYAVPNLRGGGEYGKQWHIAGTQLQKQNVFDDFIAAAEYLIDSKYTSSDYLAVRGGSNGGLLVGATLTQRPDLMRVALPAVGVLDMLRYHTFTAGAGWAYDYGTAEDSEQMFNYLKEYSPVHNVKEGVNYPATLITTGDHDDRVVPAHSFKFAAELQKKQAGTLPTLIRIETDAGHGAGTPVSKTIEQYADVFGFTLYNMGFESLPSPRISSEENLRD
ncbi:MAG: prolyl oligopeptidase family serine peptidase [Bacteroidetes bacterium]|nr:prolyl oligopeptidase family serine peptidase [Bacteroidota bacterium]